MKSFQIINMFLKSSIYDNLLNMRHNTLLIENIT